MIDAKALVDVLKDSGLSVRSYSGRGMYGSQCVGVSADSVWSVAQAIGTADDIDFEDVPEPSTDILGLGMIIYWPQIKWDDSFGGEDDEDHDEEDEE
jgi:hypothetical protein